MALFAALVVSCLFIPSGWTQQALEGSKQRAPEGSVVGRCPMTTGPQPSGEPRHAYQAHNGG